ncbi:MAG TPA: cytochrome c oxidase subunit II [Solirubrobacteraceae bacterium]|jgi:cytochrome c oxidase subunit 2|nr:cytochrome c oxidase subunit II [Solirubrobacteraceae bacterium]
MPKQRSLIYTIVAAVIAIAIGIALSFAIHWFPVQASTQAHNTDRLYHVLVIASVPIFVLVVTVILYCAWRFRMKPGEELKDGPPIHGNTRLEVLWTAAPAILLLGLISYSFVVLHDNEKKPAKEMSIGVTGQQFEWSFQYPPSVTGGKPLETHQLYLPEGESVKFDMRSKDVIHAFWIPAFRVQEDVVPGITTHWRATPDRVGSYPIVCNLLCGVGHSTMRSKVHVMPEAEFKSWLNSELASSTASASNGAGASAGTTETAAG